MLKKEKEREDQIFDISEVKQEFNPSHLEPERMSYNFEESEYVPPTLNDVLGNFNHMSTRPPSQENQIRRRIASNIIQEPTTDRRRPEIRSDVRQHVDNQIRVRQVSRNKR